MQRERERRKKPKHAPASLKRNLVPYSVDLDNILIVLRGNTALGLVGREGWLMGLGLVGGYEKRVGLKRVVVGLMRRMHLD